MTDLMLNKLISDCGLIDGRADGDFYRHQQSGKTLIKQTGALKIQSSLGITHEEPTLTTVGGRAVVAGWWTDKGGNRYWTTGDADPDGKAVEGKHPIALAEKRWRVRGILALALDPTLRSTVYGEDETDWNDGGAPARTQPAQAAPSQQIITPPASSPDWVASLNGEWGDVMDEIAGLVGKNRSDFEAVLFNSATTFVDDDGNIRTCKAKTMPELIQMYPNGKWALSAKGKAVEMAALLRDGQPAELRPARWNGEIKACEWSPPMTLSKLPPMDSANMPAQPVGNPGFDDDDNVPF
jgi:hypothetical protein